MGFRTPHGSSPSHTQRAQSSQTCFSCSHRLPQSCRILSIEVCLIRGTARHFPLYMHYRSLTCSCMQTLSKGTRHCFKVCPKFLLFLLLLIKSVVGISTKCSTSFPHPHSTLIMLNSPLRTHALRDSRQPKILPLFQRHSSAAEREAARDRKGSLTQNCLAICSYDIVFFWLGR